MSWNQNKSSFRTGEPPDHIAAKNIIMQKLERMGYDVHPEYPLVDSLVHTNYTHGYDLVAFGKLVIVEVDDPDLHSKHKHKVNDKIAENWTESFFPHATFIRLNKDLVNDDTREQYLGQNFYPKLPKN